MKNLIYQYWDGKLLPGHKASIENIKHYAERIGATHLFELNPHFVRNLGPYSPHYGSFKPIYEKSIYEVYDNVLFLDLDVFAIEGLKESPFEDFTAEIGICTEPLQPYLRSRRTKGRTSKQSEERWAQVIKRKYKTDLPRTPEGLLKVYNSGVILYSNKGLAEAKRKLPPFRDYVDFIRRNKFDTFYSSDQGYIHAMLSVCDFDWIELDNKWNALMHHIIHPVNKSKPMVDPRTPETNFVHMQFSGGMHFSKERLEFMINNPVRLWGNDLNGKPFKEVSINEIKK